MNISEANDVNTVLRFELGLSAPGDHAADEALARAAAVRLADKAHRALSAGLTAREVEQAW